MDYIDFINSRDIREYLYAIDYKLSGEQKLFLIDNCYRLPLNEKLQALKTLLQAADEEITIRNPHYMFKMPKTSRFNSGYDDEHHSLHKFTKELLETYRLLQSTLVKKEADAYYELQLLEDDYYKYEHASFDTEGLFRDYESAMACYKQHYLKEDGIRAVCIIKRYLKGNADNPKERYVKAYYDARLNLMSITDEGVLPERCHDYTTEALLIHLPLPFTAGDMLVNSADRVYFGRIHGFMCNYQVGAPFVVSAFNPDADIRRGLDASDITCSCYYLDCFEPCELTSEVNNHLYDLEYYRGEITGTQKILKILSSRIKGRQSFDDESFALSVSYCKAKALYEEARKSIAICPLVEYAFSTEADRQSFDDIRNDDDWQADLFMLKDKLKIWLDDVREAPADYWHCHSVNETIAKIHECEKNAVCIDELNLDHDLGEYAADGGDAIRLLDFLAERQTFYKVVLHTANPVGRANMQRTIDRYWPKTKKQN